MTSQKHITLCRRFVVGRLVVRRFVVGRLVTGRLVVGRLVVLRLVVGLLVVSRFVVGRLVIGCLVVGRLVVVSLDVAGAVNIFMETSLASSSAAGNTSNTFCGNFTFLGTFVLAEPSGAPFYRLLGCVNTWLTYPAHPQ